MRPAPDNAVAPAYVTGALIEMKFQERRLRLQLVPSGRALDANYSDDFEPVLLEHPRELIQVHGNVVRSEDGTPTSISDVDEILEVDESVIELRSFQSSRETLRLRQPISFQIAFDPNSKLYEATGPFDIIVTASTRPELEAQLDAELAMLWQEYALADHNVLTAAASQLREELRANIEATTDAS